MSYKKFFVDNAVCLRRFHCSYDDEEPKVAVTQIVCPVCQLKVFEATDHPELTLARDENLVNTTQFGRFLIRECQYKDPFKGPSSVQSKGPSTS